MISVGDKEEEKEKEKKNYINYLRKEDTVWLSNTLSKRESTIVEFKKHCEVS